VIQGWLPASNRHGPFLGCLADRHVNPLQGRLLAGVNLAVLGELANHAVDRFDGVGRVNRLADRGRKIEQRDDVGPLGTPLLGNRRILVVPRLHAAAPDANFSRISLTTRKNFIRTETGTGPVLVIPGASRAVWGTSTR